MLFRSPGQARPRACGPVWGFQPRQQLRQYGAAQQVVFHQPGLRDGIEGLLAYDDEGMITNIVRLVQNRELRNQIADHNRATEPNESWPHVLDLARAAYERAAALA